MITLTIAAVLATIAAPAIGRFIEANRLTTLTNEIITDFNTARAEAVKRGAQAVICKSNSAVACTAAGTWNDGWILFADLDNSGTWTQTAGSEDVMLRARPSVPPGTSITGGADSITFIRQGTLSTGSAASTFTICNSKIKKTKVLTINPLGRTALGADGTCL